MSKLILDLKVPNEYKRSDFVEIIRALQTQTNLHGEGRMAARYQAQATMPSSVAAAVGDIVWDSNATVRGSVAPGLAASYVRLGWICTAPSLTNALWQELRLLTGS